MNRALYRINCGSSVAFTDAAGNVWQEDHLVPAPKATAEQARRMAGLRLETDIKLPHGSGLGTSSIAALALLALSVWLARMGKNNKFVLYPMIFMLAVTLTALVFMFFKTLAAANIIQAIVVVALFILALILVYMAITKLRAVGKQKTAAS